MIDSAPVAIIIVSWNGKSQLQECLVSLGSLSIKPRHVVLVDNGSTDGTIDYVRAAHPGVELIALDKNHGFAQANNIGIHKAFTDSGTRYIITLNNDTCVDPDYLAELLNCAERHPDAAAVQPKIINYYDQNVLDSTGMLIAKDMSAVNRGLKEQDAGQYEQEEEVFGAAASASLYRREAIEQVALTRADGTVDYFDSDYFAYHEDVDLAWRLRLAGFKAVYTPKARVLHVHSMTGKSFSPFKAYQVHRNHYFNIIKDLPMPFILGALVRMPALYLASFLSLVRGRGAAAQLAQKKKKISEGIPFILLKSWLSVISNLPRLLAKRRQIQKRVVVDNHEIDRWFREFGADLEDIAFR